MMFKVILLTLVSAFLVDAAPLLADVPAGEAFIYKESGGKSRTMEIYFPQAHDRKVAKVPGMILFHGGSWKGGDLKQFRGACRYFASRGIVAATADYQMLTEAEVAALPKGETRKRVCISDAKSAIRWLKQNATALGVDPHKIITGGGSAGGHVSLLATLNPGLDDPADAKTFDTSVVAYLLFNPAFESGDVNDAEVDVLRFLKSGIAPAIVFFGSKDRWKVGWDPVYQRLISNGARDLQVWLADGQSHGFFNSEPWASACLDRADRFLTGRALLTKGLPINDGGVQVALHLDSNQPTGSPEKQH